MYQHETQVRVRYGETDQMGYLYYGNYPLYYEVGRTEAIRNLGLSYKAMEEEAGIALPVVECQLKYLRPAFYDNLIRIRTSIHRLEPSEMIQFHSELYNEKNKLLNQGLTTLVFYDMKLKKKVPMPQLLYQKLLPFFES